MRVIGIICEYNPFHLGHQKQMDEIRRQFGPETAIVCIMSGNYVQRGAPALLDKSLRAKAALHSGADLVLELPLVHALSSAENFAAGGVRFLAPLCDGLCFGAENPDADLMGLGKILLSPDFPRYLREQLDRGLSFPAARQQALAQMGADSDCLASPNNILAVEYCKAILSQQTAMEPIPIHRGGSYHARTPDPREPSATAVRTLMVSGEAWQAFVPPAAAQIFENAPLHTLQAGERAILAKLRTMTEPEFESLPYGSEGLWRKLMHASRSCGTLEEVIAAVKSKRYTRTRLDRMILCAFLGITARQLQTPAACCRVLAFNDVGRSLLAGAKDTGLYRNAGQRLQDPDWTLEQRAGDLYGLFCTAVPEAPGMEEARRVIYHH